MNQLVSMVVPLETLPGWPVAPTVSWLHALGLLVGLPLVAIIIISTIGKVGAKVSANRSGPDDRPQLGAGSGGADDGAVGARSGSAALTQGAGGQTADAAQSGAVEEQTKVGGASARW